MTVSIEALTTISTIPMTTARVVLSPDCHRAVAAGQPLLASRDGYQTAVHDGLEQATEQAIEAHGIHGLGCVLDETHIQH